MVLSYEADSGQVEACIARAATGWLRDAYPLGARDVELHVSNSANPALMAEALREVCNVVFDADPACRRLIASVDARWGTAAQSMRAAGLRHVTDVDVIGAELNLYVAEPDWVTIGDRARRVPGC